MSDSVGTARVDRMQAVQAIAARHADALDGFPVAGALATWPPRSGAAPPALLCLLQRWCAHLDEDIALLAASRHPSAVPARERLVAARAAIDELIASISGAAPNSLPGNAAPRAH